MRKQCVRDEALGRLYVYIVRSNCRQSRKLCKLPPCLRPCQTPPALAEARAKSPVATRPAGSNGSAVLLRALWVTLQCAAAAAGAGRPKCCAAAAAGRAPSAPAESLMSRPRVGAAASLPPGLAAVVEGAAVGLVGVVGGALQAALPQRVVAGARGRAARVLRQQISHHFHMNAILSGSRPLKLCSADKTTCQRVARHGTRTPNSDPDSCNRQRKQWMRHSWLRAQLALGGEALLLNGSQFRFFFNIQFHVNICSLRAHLALRGEAFLFCRRGLQQLGGLWAALRCAAQLERHTVGKR